MAQVSSGIKIHWETRNCMVCGRPGYFHTWEQMHTESKSQVFGIVEFSDGVQRVQPCDIRFVDEVNSCLQSYEKWLKEHQTDSR